MQAARTELCRAYRALLRTSSHIDPGKFGQAEGKLVEHVIFRVRTEKMLAKDAVSEGPVEITQDDLEQATRNMLALESMLDKLVVIEPSDAPALFSFISATQQPGGNPTYHRELESGFLRMAAFHDRYQLRVKEEEERGASTKNRALQFACRDYGEVLTEMEKNPIGEDNDTELFLSSYRHRQPDLEYEVLQAPETVLVEVDHERHRVSLYIHTHISATEEDQDHVTMQEWALEPEGVLFAEEVHLAAMRVVREVREHRSKLLPEGYALCLSGHGVGGSIATIAAIYFKDQYSLNLMNVITFGAPRLTTTFGCAPLMELPLVRLVTPLDVKPGMPRFCTKGRRFLPYGEELSLLPSRLATIATPEFIEEHKLEVTMEEYNMIMNDELALLEFSPAPEYLAVQNAHHDNVASFSDEDIEFSKRKLKQSQTTRKFRREEKLRNARKATKRTRSD
eukprot:TRINITY_DN32236_c0_g1_i1.p1 TRINITY_DN32236_c0_g1~~TRINITY_DN32236_c0_g1_i1.p1  ORF type:complete len:452 (+),score=95.38 TRINITY_DN32236_c0_g1_i1:195-1550(+)